MKNKGFTLTELMVVMAVFGILLGIAAISGSAWMDRYRVEGQTKEMYSDLMNARVSALQRNRVFLATLAVNQYAIYEDTYPSPDGNGAPDLGPGQDRLVARRTIQYDLNSNYDITTTRIYLSANGLASPDGMRIWFTSSANPGSNCISLSTTRILMGKMNGTNCVVQ